MPDEFDPTLDADEEAPEGATDEDSTAEDESDPADAVTARLVQLETTVAALKGLDPNAIRSAIGRVSALQSSLDELSKRDPAADFDPRVSASESAVVALAEALLNDPSLSDATRTTLTNAVRGVTTARDERQQAAREAALEQKLRKELTPARAAEAAETVDDPWQQASITVIGRAQKLGVDPKTIPWDEIQAKSDGTPQGAVAEAIEWLVENKPDVETAQVSARKKAAGTKSPARTAAADSPEQLRTRAETVGIPMTDEAARKALAKELGVSL